MIQDIQNIRTSNVNFFRKGDFVKPLVVADLFFMENKNHPHSHRFVDYSGQKFGRWNVIEFSCVKSGGSYFKCRCDCGTIRDIKISSLKNGRSQSCGCYQKEVFLKVITKHGHVYEPLFKTWTRMNNRCYCEGDASYSDYGGRGIKVSDEFSDYNVFSEYATSLPDYDKKESHKLSLDRINNDGNYERGNLRWGDNIIQGNNKRNNVFVTYNGKTQTISQWARELKVGRCFIDTNIKKYGALHFFTVKLHENIRNKTIGYNGVNYTLKQLCEISGIKRETISYRLKSGWGVDDAINKPVKKYSKQTK